MELGPKNIGYLLAPNYSIDSVLRFDCNSKVCFLLAEVGPKNIGYFLKHDYSIMEWVL